MRIRLNYIPQNWNEYIRIERTNKYKANNLKQQEKQLVSLMAKGLKYDGKYPVRIVFRPHYKNLRQDLDNFRIKGLLDGLVSAGVLKNDNLACIQKIDIEPIFDNTECVDIEIKELEK